MTIASARREVERFGWSSTLGALGLRALDRAADFHLLRAVALESVDAELSRCPPRYAHGFLDEAAIRRFSRDPANHLPGSFVDDALSHGDLCYGLFDGGVLASFGWYSRRPTPLDHGLVFHVGPGHVYKYNSYTRPEHRAQRLHAKGAMHALHELRRQGATALVGFIDGANQSSRKSWRRMGALELGTVYVLRTDDRCFLHVDAGCRRYGLRIALPAGPDEQDGRVAAR